MNARNRMRPLAALPLLAVLAWSGPTRIGAADEPPKPDEVRRLEELLKREKAANLELREALDQLRKELDRRQKQAAELQAVLKEQEARTADLLRKAAAEKDVLANDLARAREVGKILEKQAAEDRALSEKLVEAARKEQLRRLDELKSALDRAAKAEAEAAAQRDRGRLLEQRVAEVEKELARLRQGANPPVVPPPNRNPPPEAVEGTIKTIKDDLVVVTVGGDAGLAKGHTLEVFRLEPKPMYLGTIRIETVTGKEAVGRFVGKPAAPPQAGDRVASRILGK